MNNSYNKEIIKKICPSVKKIKLYKNSVIYKDGNDKKWVLKDLEENNIIEIYNYLNSRGFDYVPKLEYCDNNVYVYEYVNDTPTPKEQRASDLIKLDALLHNKTVYYKDISLDELKEFYENIDNVITNTFNYYDDILTAIESRIYMSPSEYMLARNCSVIFSCLNFCKSNLDDWYEMMKKKTKQRIVFLHNNLDTNHIIRNDGNVLISWNKSKRGLPIYDFISFYKRNYDKYDFNELYKEYLKKFPLLDEERKLLFIMLFLPEKINYQENELLNTNEVSRLCNYLVITDKLFMENEAKNTEKQDHKVDE